MKKLIITAMLMGFMSQGAFGVNGDERENSFFYYILTAKAETEAGADTGTQLTDIPEELVPVGYLDLKVQMNWCSWKHKESIRFTPNLRKFIALRNLS